MTNEEKQVLLVDICAKLPYGLKIKTIDNIITDIFFVAKDGDVFGYGGAAIHLDEFKVFLRPMSSMTGEEMLEIEQMNNNSIQHIDTIGVRFQAFYDTCYNEMYDLFDYLNAHHFDYRGLIKKGLALEAPTDMYNTKQ